jgi:hypothetical protein
MTSASANENNSALLDRLQKLESENRKMKRFGASVLVAIAVLILMGQAGKSRALDADSLVIRDTSGRVRIEIGTGDDTSPTLKMFGGSDNKNPSVVLSSNQKGSGLSFWGKELSVPLLLLTNNADGGPSLLLIDSTGGTSIGVASVNTYDSDKFSAFLGRTGTVNPKTGATTQTSAASLTLFGKDGKVVWQAP